MYAASRIAASKSYIERSRDLFITQSRAVKAEASYLSEPCIMKPIVVGVAPRIIPFIPCMACICQTQPDLRHTALSSNNRPQQH